MNAKRKILIAVIGGAVGAGRRRLRLEDGKDPSTAGNASRRLGPGRPPGPSS